MSEHASTGISIKEPEELSGIHLWGIGSLWWQLLLKGTAFAFPHWWPKQQININLRGALAPNQ